MAAAAWWRISQRYADVWPSWRTRAGWSEVRPYMAQAGWISVAQVAQVFLTGSDLLLLGAVLGAGAVVQYSCTGKLATVLSNHPQLIMQAATPALSELRAGSRREQLLEASVALMLAMLTLSGLVACVVLSLNGSFVRWWVGPDQYAGHRLTVFFALHLMVRHLNITFIYGLFCFGRERRISLTNLADGVVSLAAGFVLMKLFGPMGAILGSLLAVTVVSLPANVLALARETGTTPLALCGQVWPWLWRFALIGGAAAALPLAWKPDGVPAMLALGATVSVLYALVMLQGLLGGPLGIYARPRLTALLPLGWRLRLSAP
jgi:O-antigen/teichoic acid export membrane protein